MKIPRGGLAGEIARKVVKKSGFVQNVVEAVVGAGLLTGYFVAWQKFDPQGYKKAVDDADGDLIEALHGHKCGPSCWHKTMRP